MTIEERRIRLSRSADRDLTDLYDYLAMRASPARAEAYLNRVTDFISQLRFFSERGTRRDQVRTGLRTVGFEKRISISFVVGEDEVVILRILYGGRTADLSKTD